MSFYLFGLIEMAVVQYLFLGAQGLKGREDEDGLYFVKAGLSSVLLIMGVGLVANGCWFGGLFRYFWNGLEA
jgi:hypothetical protein